MSPNMGRAQMDLERRTELRAKQQTQDKLKKQADESSHSRCCRKLEELRQERQKFVQEDKWEDALAVHEEILQIEPSSSVMLLKDLCSMHWVSGQAIFTYRQL